MEEYKVLAISTCHITIKDSATLNKKSKGLGKHMILSRDTGWFIKLYEELEYNLKSEFSPSLIKIITFAHGNGYKMIELDADATEYPKLFEVFDW